ncbi:DUF58 domain-containing protein [Paenibacillus caui]|uniref:DUF58 domain-containing protein n=1 Tax=Paenibacillus caui TaxID=2873927 RepID=UPI003080FC06
MLFQGGKTSIMLFVMVSLLCAYWLFGALGTMLKTKGSRSLSVAEERGSIQAGSQVSIHFHMEPPRFLPVPYVIVREVLKRHTGESWSFEESVIPNVRSGGRLAFQTPPLERGKYTFADTELIYEDIFGLVEHKRTIFVPGGFQVLPRTVYIPRWHLFDRGFRMAGPETIQAYSRRETTQLSGVRDYVYGDRMSRIHWNATAKTGTWKSKEFEHESMPRTMLVLDGLSSSYAGKEQFELAVSTTASLLAYGERNGISMGLCTLGEKPTIFPPETTLPHRQQMIYHLVDLNPAGYGNNRKRLETKKHAFKPGILFVYISPNTGEQSLDVLSWARQRQMTPYHVEIGGSAHGVQAQGVQADGRENLPLQQSIRGVYVTSLKELPTAMGGGRI